MRERRWKLTKLIIQISCYNEEDTISEVIAAIPSEIDGFDYIEILN